MLSLAELKVISTKCGLASTLSRPLQLEALKKFYDTDVCKFPTRPGPILSLDLGLKNLAACQVIEESGHNENGAIFRVLKWRKYDLNLPDTYNPLHYAEVVKNFSENTLLRDFEGDFVFIERQRYRSGSNAAVLETIVRLAILEAQLHCYLSGRVKCVPVNPGAVARYFDLPTGKEKKVAAVKMVKDMLERADVLKIDSEVEKEFLNQRKQDDLADCLLQAMASLNFKRNCRNFFAETNEIVKKTVNVGGNGKKY